MSIKIEIFADNNSALAGDLEYLASLVQPIAETGPVDVTLNLRQALKGAPLDVVRELVNELFDPQGFEVVIKDRGEATPESQESPPEPEPPEPAPAKAARKHGGGRPKLIPDAKTAAERLKGNGADGAPEVDPLGPADDEPGSTPEADRDLALETLGGLIANPKTDPKVKQEAMTFAQEKAKENGTDKLTKLGAEKFPAILAEMKKRFPKWLSPATPTT